MSAGDVKHDYHLVNPSPWPLVGSIAACVMAIGGVIAMKGLFGLPKGDLAVFLAGLAGVIFTMAAWWREVTIEANQGDHTPVVSIGLRYGMIMFIASEVMFFVAWFWAFFDASLFTGEAIHPDCVDAVSHTARLLESLGHHVEPAFPAALDDPRAAARFSALWATNMAANRDGLATLIGRDVTIDDIELMNWSMAEYASKLSALDYALATNAAGAFRRRVAQWWEDGWDLLLTPTTSAPPLPVGTSRNDPSDPGATGRIAADWVSFTSQFNTTGQPAISLPLHWNADGLPIGVQLVAAYAREDILIRVASQLEDAAPWAQRRPAI